MKQVIAAVVTTLFTVSTAFAANALNEQQKLSYAMGVMTAKSFKLHQIHIDSHAFTQGLQDQSEGRPLRMSNQQIEQSLDQFQKQSLKRMMDQYKKTAEHNAEASKTFLLNNQNKPGIKTTPSGLQYKVITAGTGAQPSLNSTVTVNYEGKTIDGKIFDSSYRRGKPITFAVKNVIKGWQQALTMMKAGSTWELYIPAKLAYGKRGVAGSIGPNQALIFKVNLIAVK